MADTLTPAMRSALMARVRGAGNALEERLQSVLHTCLGRRYKLATNVRAMPGTPDVVLPGLRIAVFAHGCFWHRCPIHHRTPKTRVAFWSKKLATNARRDRATARTLRAMGWAVWTVWEHDLTPRRITATTHRFKRRLAKRIRLRREGAPTPTPQ